MKIHKRKKNQRKEFYTANRLTFDLHMNLTLQPVADMPGVQRFQPPPLLQSREDSVEMPATTEQIEAALET